jgi:hypothetical protein
MTCCFLPPGHWPAGLVINISCGTDDINHQKTISLTAAQTDAQSSAARKFTTTLNLGYILSSVSRPSGQTAESVPTYQGAASSQTTGCRFFVHPQQVCSEESHPQKSNNSRVPTHHRKARVQLQMMWWGWGGRSLTMLPAGYGAVPKELE